jgi:hypothetical protein
VETPLCNFCGHPGHFIRQCPDAEEYIWLGRCRRTAEGKITLPTGSFVSRDIPGRFMKLRIDEWHYRSSGYLRTRCMLSPLCSRVDPTAEALDSGLSTPITSALHVSSLCDTAKCHITLPEVAECHVTSPNIAEHCIASCDIAE